MSVIQPIPAYTRVIINTDDSGWNNWGTGDEGIVVNTPMHSTQSFVWVIKPGALYHTADPFAIREVTVLNRPLALNEQVDMPGTKKESADDVFERQLNEVRRGIKASEVHA